VEADRDDFMLSMIGDVIVAVDVAVAVAVFAVVVDDIALFVENGDDDDNDDNDDNDDDEVDTGGILLESLLFNFDFDSDSDSDSESGCSLLLLEMAQSFSNL